MNSILTCSVQQPCIYHSTPNLHCRLNSQHFQSIILTLSQRRIHRAILLRSSHQYYQYVVSRCGDFRKELLVRMNAGSTTSDQLEGKDLFDISDSGGQLMFHEVLPVFVTNTMFGILTIKLNEGLDSHPLVECYTNGEHIGKPFKSPFTHLQTFHHCMRVLQSTCERGKCPKIAFIGTHKDLEHECSSEDRKEKNLKLLSIIPLQMKDTVISCTSESLLFTINAKNPGDDDQAVLTILRQLLLNELLKVP